MTPARETLLGFSVVRGRAEMVWKCVVMGEKKYRRGRISVSVLLVVEPQMDRAVASARTKRL